MIVQEANIENLFHFEISEIIKKEKLYEEFDEDYQSYVFDEDAVIDYLEEKLEDKPDGNIIDYHGSDFFPERYFDLVVVLRCDTDLLYKRLKKREYSEKKISENVGKFTYLTLRV
jgi:broad-specificity NMP kinase